jgi:hypothetical protein
MCPYIKQEFRQAIDPYITPLITSLQKVPIEQQDGILNYIVTRILHDIYKPSYVNYNRSCGVLQCILMEWYRRCVAKYEDTKIKENGDI